jgi:molecular chaperone GrpE
MTSYTDDDVTTTAQTSDLLWQSSSDQDTDQTSPENDHISDTPVYDPLAQLQAELSKMTDIAKMAQSNYLRTKMEFDQYQTRIANQAQEDKQTILFGLIGKIAPVIDQMKLSLDHVNTEHQDLQLVKGIRLIYDNMLKVLESYKIYPISSLWWDLDPHIHEPVGTVAVQDDMLRGKIAQELNTWYVYKDQDQQLLVVSSKVLLGE